jgi:hypothetical protein
MVRGAWGSRLSEKFGRETGRGGLYCSLGFRVWIKCVRFMEEVEMIAEFLGERK